MKAIDPVVSVLMPVYNAAPYVEAAIRSILTQTFVDFELLVFNDGSQDESSAIIRGIQDDRLVFFDYPQNSGYVAHLNAGLRQARGIYIARMDADDIALPDRLACQVALLHNDPRVLLCGTAYTTFGQEEYDIKVPLLDREIRHQMLFHNPMVHSTVMFRRSIVQQYSLFYDAEYMPAEDYKLWYDFSKVGELRNLPIILLRYRLHPQQISVLQHEQQRRQIMAIRILQLAERGFVLSEEQQHWYRIILNQGEYLHKPAELRKAMMVMLDIVHQNEKLHAYEPVVFLNYFRTRWRDLATNLGNYEWSVLPLLLTRNPINANVWTQMVIPACKAIVRWQARKLLSWRAKMPVE